MRKGRMFAVIWAGLVVLLALLTNRWLGWEEGIRFVQANDVPSAYWLMVRAAPMLPEGGVSFHHAQRFFFPYFLGTISWVVGVDSRALFFATTSILHLAMLIYVWRLLGRWDVPPRRKLVAWAALIFQPYFLRYYWLAPGMVADVGFEFGALILFAGLASRSSILPWVGLGLATLSRQTGVMLLPGALLWVLWVDEGLARRWAWAWGFALYTIGIYQGTAWIAARFGTANFNLKHALELFVWLRSPDANASALFEHTLRCALPLAPAVFLLLAEGPAAWKRETWCAVMWGGAIAAQPFLSGPTTTGQNAARLVTLGLLPLVLAWAANSRREWPLFLSAAFGVALFAGSFHHLFTWIGPSGAVGTATLQILISFAAIVAGGLARRRSVLQY